MNSKSLDGKSLLNSKKQNVKGMNSSKQEVSLIYEKIAANISGFVFQFVLTKDDSMYFSFISSGIKRLFGDNIESLKESALNLLNSVHTDEIQALQISIKNSAQNLTLWDHTFRIVDTHKNVKWVQGIATPEEGNDGQIIWHGLLYDVTEKKLSEEILLKQQKQLDEIAFIQAHEFRRPIANMLGIFDIINLESANQNFDHQQMVKWLKLMEKSVKETDDIIAKIVTKATEKNTI